jgi:hypothetical protein
VKVFYLVVSIYLFFFFFLLVDFVSTKDTHHLLTINVEMEIEEEEKRTHGRLG